MVPNLHTKDLFQHVNFFKYAENKPSAGRHAAGTGSEYLIHEQY